MENALIIFVRYPEPGKVKTRIAAKLGNAVALSVYQKLLQHTQEIIGPLPVQKFIFYAENVPEMDQWSTEDHSRYPQASGDLGERMRAAFNIVFKKGFKKACIIGSDCHELTTDHIKDAFDHLSQKDIVIGPAKDGGYYLMGMKEPHPHIFKDIHWSTNHVFKDTLSIIQQSQLTYAFLPMLNDIDEPEDIPSAWIK